MIQHCVCLVHELLCQRPSAYASVAAYIQLPYQGKFYIFPDDGGCMATEMLAIILNMASEFHKQSLYLATQVSFI